MISNVFKCRKCSEQMWKHCEAWTFTRTYKKDVKACCNSWCQCQSALRSGCAGQDTQRMTLFNLSTSKWSKLCFASITSIFAASSRRRPSTRTSCHSHSGVGTEKKKNLHISTLSYYPTMWNFRQSERGPGAGRVIIQPPSPRIDTQNHALHSEQCTICGISPGHWKNLENAQEISRDPTESIGDFADSVACCCLLLPVAACCCLLLVHTGTYCILGTELQGDREVWTLYSQRSKRTAESAVTSSHYPHLIQFSSGLPATAGTWTPPSFLQETAIMDFLILLWLCGSPSKRHNRI